MLTVIREMQIKTTMRDFPCGPMERIHLTMQGTQVQSLVRELRSHKPCGVAKKKKKIHGLFYRHRGAISTFRAGELLVKAEI